MQDKFSIGPVNIVQLVGLTAKPRIASAQADGAARAADPIPPSAAAGLGDDLSKPIAEIVSSYLNVKAAPVLNLSSDSMGSHIALEAGVDRPIVDANAPASAVDPSISDDFLPRNNPVDPSAPVRGEVTSPDGAAAIVPNVAEKGETDAPVSSVADSTVLGYVFDGVDSFGDDKILDFSANSADIPPLLESPSEPFMVSTEFDAVLLVKITDDLSGFALSDPSADTTFDHPLTKSDLTVIDPLPSAADAIPVI